MKHHILLVLLALFWSTQTQALDLQVSGKLHITLPEPQRLAHFSGVLIVWGKDRGRISHRYLSAKNYLSVDMRGILPAFFCYEFGQAGCPPLPRWLQVLASDSARVAKLKQGRSWVNEVGSQRIYAHYLEGRGTGFIPEEDGVHIIEYKGDVHDFKRMLNSIREVKE